MDKLVRRLRQANRSTEQAIVVLDPSRVPDWPERCYQCLTQNNLDPATTIYCDPDIDCPYYPFNTKPDEITHKGGKPWRRKQREE